MKSYGYEKWFVTPNPSHGMIVHWEVGTDPRVCPNPGTVNGQTQGFVPTGGNRCRIHCIIRDQSRCAYPGKQNHSIKCNTEQEDANRPADAVD
jgi:hypothetical protein